MSKRLGAGGACVCPAGRTAFPLSRPATRLRAVFVGPRSSTHRIRSASARPGPPTQRGPPRSRSLPTRRAGGPWVIDRSSTPLPRGAGCGGLVRQACLDGRSTSFPGGSCRGRRCATAGSTGPDTGGRLGAPPGASRADSGPASRAVPRSPLDRARRPRAVAHRPPRGASPPHRDPAPGASCGPRRAAAASPSPSPPRGGLPDPGDQSSGGITDEAPQAAARAESGEGASRGAGLDTRQGASSPQGARSLPQISRKSRASDDHAPPQAGGGGREEEVLSFTHPNLHRACFKIRGCIYSETHERAQKKEHPMRRSSILVAIDNGQLRRTVTAMLLTQGWEVIEASVPIRPVPTAGRHTPELVIADRCYREFPEAFVFTRNLSKLYPAIPIILIAERSSEEQAIAVLKAGANNYIKQPFAEDEMVAAVRRCLSGREEQAPSEGSAEVSGLMDGHRMVGESQAMCGIKAHLGRVAGTDSTVLITEESGTGKELIAEMIHRQSARRQDPFVCINCAAIPDALLESELFGSERGAFTGALSKRDGLLKQANGGTIFFDEIGDMSLYAQAKVLLAIETKIICPLGGNRSIAMDIRIIAATNQDLKRLMKEGKFRQDLYFRLNVTKLHLLPLRQRKEDIPLLLTHYLQELNRRFGSKVEGFTEQALTCLIRYEWPGNVRELKNLVEAIMVNHPSRWIDIEDFPEPLSPEPQEEVPRQTERDRLIAVLFATNWNKSKAAFSCSKYGAARRPVRNRGSSIVHGRWQRTPPTMSTSWTTATDAFRSSTLWEKSFRPLRKTWPLPACSTDRRILPLQVVKGRRRFSCWTFRLTKFFCSTRRGIPCLIPPVIRASSPTCISSNPWAWRWQVMRSTSATTLPVTLSASASTIPSNSSAKPSVMKDRLRRSSWMVRTSSGCIRVIRCPPCLLPDARASAQWEASGMRSLSA